LKSRGISGKRWRKSWRRWGIE